MIITILISVNDICCVQTVKNCFYRSTLCIFVCSIYHKTFIERNILYRIYIRTAKNFLCHQIEYLDSVWPYTEIKMRKYKPYDCKTKKIHEQQAEKWSKSILTLKILFEKHSFLLKNSDGRGGFIKPFFEIWKNSLKRGGFY